jgi:negative regulator of sigma-B (phosphoserine phosphatase)
MSSPRQHRPAATSRLEWGVASRPLPGEASSGDAHIVQASGEAIVVGVLDALGHGDEAAATARIATDTLSRYAGEPIVSLIQRCHHALIGTRGAVLSLASFDLAECSMTWLGVGDVEGLLVLADPGAVPAQVTLTTLGGIVGGRMPPTRPWVIPVSHGDTLIFTTDGIRNGVATGLYPTGSPQLIADHVLARGFKGTDDGLVLVARVRERSAEA